ncbi:hypothetical protein B0T18DRAFT_229739 [Schizothecium vesticola]|uniref:SWIM-type domain-containing protein n=1 Tax=Schizothecium vesticola TaxID=314040 RepID=A0AA40EL93_9PEZI|nr:hypothetical protein B0T18DRAFT_229739 [Schizothecium vesticola]
MSCCDQWANYYIRHYRNFGVRTTSPTESNNLSIKSYLLNGRSSAHSLILASHHLTQEQVRQNVEEMAKQALRARHDFLHRPWLGGLPLKVSYKALDLIVQEYRYANAAIPSNPASQTRPLAPCRPDTCTATIQYSIPCRHDIHAKLAGGERLELREVHTHWHLQMSLIERDKYLEIQEPKIVENRKGRPKNSTRPLSEDLGIASTPRTPGSQRQKTPGSTPGPPRGSAPCLQPSIRRIYSAFETAEEPQPPPAPPKRRGRPPGSKNKKTRQPAAAAVSEPPAIEPAQPRTALVIASAPRRGLLVTEAPARVRKRGATAAAPRDQVGEGTHGVVMPSASPTPIEQDGAQDGAPAAPTGTPARKRRRATAATPGDQVAKAHMGW